MTALESQGLAAKQSCPALAGADTALKNRALSAIAETLDRERGRWLSANEKDMAAAEKTGLSKAMQDRLLLTDKRIDGIIDGIRHVISLPDPVGETMETVTRPNGLKIEKVRVPLGVIGIIYEARPNVTVDAAVLCLKSGNVCILRGGKEAIESNRAVVSLMQDALESTGLPRACVSLVQDTSRDSANELMHLNDYIDVLIPRGGAGLIRSVSQNASVPVIRTGEGVCHVYVDQEADLRIGAVILENAKCSRPSVCNACECAVLHSGILTPFLSKALPLLNASRIELRMDERSLKAAEAFAADHPEETSGLSFKPAEESDWDKEYNDYILAVKTVDSAEEAVSFIREHTTQHSEAIVTNDPETAERFLNAIDAAAVYVNASTRFTDGGEFGLGAEIGISTQKMHARGPMGLKELTSYKYKVYGTGQIR